MVGGWGWHLTVRDCSDKDIARIKNLRAVLRAESALLPPPSPHPRLSKRQACELQLLGLGATQLPVLRKEAQRSSRARFSEDLAVVTKVRRANDAHCPAANALRHTGKKLCVLCGALG